MSLQINNKIKFYTYIDFNKDNTDKRILSEFLKPYTKLDLNEDEKKERFGDFFNIYERVDTIEEAHFTVLPYHWNFYRSNMSYYKPAKEMIDESLKQNKDVLSFTVGDFGVTPLNKNVVLLRQSGYKSKRLEKEYGMPVILTDPIKVFFNNEMNLLTKTDKAKVGFCGQAGGNLYNYAKVTSITIMRNILYALNLASNEPQTVYPAILRRKNIITKLNNSNLIDADFIIRTKYRGGAVTPEQERKTTLEFYDNLNNNPYIVCMRGGGNFSVRFYESLALGRIPLYVDTDCLLPLDNQIDWKKHVVWVDNKDISRIDQILADFHAQIHPDDFKQMQLDNRKLWLEKLTFAGFFQNLDAFVKLSNIK